MLSTAALLAEYSGKIVQNDRLALPFALLAQDGKDLLVDASRFLEVALLELETGEVYHGVDLASLVADLAKDGQGPF